MRRSILPHGTWPSPITPAHLATAGVTLSEPAYDGDVLYWRESLATEGGRSCIVRRGPEAAPEVVTPSDVDVRTRCHEYGGGSYAVGRGLLVTSHDDDRRLYITGEGGAPAPITPVPPDGEEWRFADMHIAGTDVPFVVAVRERHATSLAEPEHALVRIDPRGERGLQVIRHGRDFYAAPVVSPDGKRLAWLEWSHPDMPWDAAEAWVAELGADGTLSNARRVAGGPAESAFQPSFSPAGRLHVVSDRTGWWNLYADPGGTWTNLTPSEAEFASPLWVFGLSTYAFLSRGRIAAVSIADDVERLGVIDRASGGWTDLGLPFTNYGYGCRLVGNGGGRVAAVVATPSHGPAVVEFDLDDHTHEIVARSSDLDFAPEAVSVGEAVVFPGEMGPTHAYFYPPASVNHEGPAGDRPPVVVMGHGGPTSRSSAEFTLGVQFWTSRGFAVVDVNYSGSTGYGRAYRERLHGQWGVIDVADCCDAVRHLADAGRVDPARAVIRGGSAGGFTALAAVAFHDAFAAGTSRYGVADLELLATHTHKFEARYLDRLIGPYPETRERYRARSPIHHVEGFHVPVLVMQGLQDRVVPPSQAEVLVGALRKRGRPVAYETFADEGHGFRSSESVVRSIELELAFYGRVLGFEPHRISTLIRIENFPPADPSSRTL